MTHETDTEYLIRKDAEDVRVAADRTLDPDYDSATRGLASAKAQLVADSDATTRARDALALIEERGGVDYLLSIGVVSTIVEIKQMMKRGEV